MTADRPIVVVGTGFAGFGAGHRLDAAGRRYVVLDKNPYLGGHTASYVQPDGWVFDDGPHVSFTKDERVQAILADAVDGAFESVPIGLDNYWQGHRFTHPAQVNLHGLPTELVVRILVDFVAAREIADPEITNYEQWCRAAFGDTFAETFPMTYGRKYHTTEMANLTTDWLGPRMYRPDLAEVLRGALAESPIRDLHYVTHFRYPSYGGYASYLRKWAAGADVRLSAPVAAVDPAAREVVLEDGTKLGYARLISSMPLPELIPRLVGAPPVVTEAASRLAFTSVVMVNLGVSRPDSGDAHITYVYDEDLVFSRLSYPHRLSPHTVPEGAGAIQAEIYFSDKYKPMPADVSAFPGQVIRDLVRMGKLRDDDRVLFQEVRTVRYGNVIYDHERADALKIVHGHLDELGIHYCGRYGDWNHEWTDEAFLSGETAAQRALDAEPAPVAARAAG